MKDYGSYLREIFPGLKVQKISVNAGFSCPNRDGTIGIGGCIYCRNDSFSPEYCMKSDSVASQIENGKNFFSRKYPEMKYLAYFQSYTNTYGRDVDSLRKLYEDALGCDGVVGLVIGTRPDTISDEVFGLLAEIADRVPVFLEIGAESSSDHTLRLINRGHTWSDVENAVKKGSAAGLHCGLHLIAGLPGESEADILENVRKSCLLPIETLKIHQLQILFGTPLFNLWQSGELEVTPFELEDYIRLCRKIIGIVPEDIVIERFLAQSPPEMVAAPRWGIKNYQFRNML